MRKQSIWSVVKEELFYWILILLLNFFFLYLVIINVSKEMLFGVGILNILLLESWITRTFFMYSGRRISQYSEVIQRISFRDRLFEYFILPAIFLSTFMTYLYFNKDIVMAYWVIFLCMGILLIFFVNVKSSLSKVYSLSSLTKGIFDFVCLMTFYLSLNILIRFDLSMTGILSIITGLALLMLIAELQLHDRLTFISLLLAILSAIFVSLSVGVFIFQSIFIATAIGTLAFYLIISLWNIRFSGKYKFVDYLTPLIYGVIALILIFNL